VIAAVIVMNHEIAAIESFDDFGVTPTPSSEMGQEIPFNGVPYDE
jgi:hypothetical protein